MKSASKTSHSKEIFKVQMPIWSYPEPMLLIYNEDQSIMEHLPVTEEIRDTMNGELKAYFWGKLREDGMLEIEEIAPWQDW